MNFFVKTTPRFRMTLDILKYLQQKGANGATYTTMKKSFSTSRITFISKVLIPNGYVKKMVKYRKPSYQKVIKYYLTSEGEDFILELENNYKEVRMKALYGRII